MLRSFLAAGLALGVLTGCDVLPQALFGHDKGEDPASKTDAVETTPDADGGVAALPARDPFEGAAAYAPIKTSTVTTDHHLGDSNAGTDCLACHGRDMGAPAFVLAGTVPGAAAGAQVRVVDADGREVASVGTDANGNFWFPGTVAFPAGSSVGIRNGDVTQKMSGRISGGSCNTASCHTRARPIFLAK